MTGVRYGSHVDHKRMREANEKKCLKLVLHLSVSEYKFSALCDNSQFICSTFPKRQTSAKSVKSHSNVTVVVGNVLGHQFKHLSHDTYLYFRVGKLLLFMLNT